MIDLISGFLKQFKFLGLEEVLIIKKHAQVRHFKKGDIILDSEQLHKHVGIILQGVVRSYITKPNGEEFTLLIAEEGMHVGTAESVFKNEISDLTIEAISNGTLILFDTEQVDKYEKSNPKLLFHKTWVLQNELLESMGRVRFFATLNPVERYQYLQQKRPKLLKRVPQKYIASYIGVSEVSLSRIKKRLEEQ